MCTTDVLDTFKNVFVRDMGRRDPAVSVPLVPPAEFIKAIYEAVRSRCINLPAHR
jgi:hypothetical protein